MLYEFQLTVPAGTTETLPEVLSCPVSPGVLTRLMILFPPGCAGLVRLHIKRSNHIEWPSSPDVWFASDDETIDFAELYELTDLPYEFILEAWNEDASFDHTLYVRFNILPATTGQNTSLAQQVRSFLGLR